MSFRGQGAMDIDSQSKRDCKTDSSTRRPASKKTHLGIQTVHLTNRGEVRRDQSTKITEIAGERTARVKPPSTEIKKDTERSVKISHVTKRSDAHRDDGLDVGQNLHKPQIPAPSVAAVKVIPITKRTHDTTELALHEQLNLHTYQVPHEVKVTPLSKQNYGQNSLSLTDQPRLRRIQPPCDLSIVPMAPIAKQRDQRISMDLSLRGKKHIWRSQAPFDLPRAATTAPLANRKDNNVVSTDDIDLEEMTGNKVQHIIRRFNSFNSYRNVSEVAKARVSRMFTEKAGTRNESTVQTTNVGSHCSINDGSQLARSKVSIGSSKDQNALKSRKEDIKVSEEVAFSQRPTIDIYKEIDHKGKPEVHTLSYSGISNRHSHVKIQHKCLDVLSEEHNNIEETDTIISEKLKSRDVKSEAKENTGHPEEQPQTISTSHVDAKLRQIIYADITENCIIDTPVVILSQNIYPHRVVENKTVSHVTVNQINSENNNITVESFTAEKSDNVSHITTSGISLSTESLMTFRNTVSEVETNNNAKQSIQDVHDIRARKCDKTTPNPIFTVENVDTPRNVSTGKIDTGHNFELKRTAIKVGHTKEASFEYNLASDRINNALITLKSELKTMREQDLVLLRQLISINENIQILSGTRKLRLSKSLSLSYGGLQPHTRGQLCSLSSMERQGSAPHMAETRRVLFSSTRQLGSVDDSMNSIDECDFDIFPELDEACFYSTLSLFGQMSPTSPEPRQRLWSRGVNGTLSLESLEGNEQSYEEILRRNVRLWKLSVQSHHPVIEEVTCLL